MKESLSVQERRHFDVESHQSPTISVIEFSPVASQMHHNKTATQHLHSNFHNQNQPLIRSASPKESLLFKLPPSPPPPLPPPPSPPFFFLNQENLSAPFPSTSPLPLPPALPGYPIPSSSLSQYRHEILSNIQLQNEQDLGTTCFNVHIHAQDQLCIDQEHCQYRERGQGLEVCK
ncbi:unnamed protein product [Protopolystoma xenopodis]|uniref:Uncharacterized protein n=1 Tax=Protopolystoma xenopodis TaxID=117903 RepID=A0A448WGP9_9PLAT|nr:unnamed protein product [Protopolystoma xenopodis]